MPRQGRLNLPLPKLHPLRNGLSGAVKGGNKPFQRHHYIISYHFLHFSMPETADDVIIDHPD